MMYIHPVEYQGISIHSLRVEGDFPYKGKAHVDGISIHSLRVEGDPFCLRFIFASKCISIHSLRVEGDLTTPDRRRERNYFNPLPPCGGRPFVGVMSLWD